MVTIYLHHPDYHKSQELYLDITEAKACKVAKLIQRVMVDGGWTQVVIKGLTVVEYGIAKETKP